jgi:uncharacterized protein YerC
MKISEFKSRKEWADNAWQRILKDVQNPDLRNALDTLLSPYEKNIIVNRFAAVILIKEGKTYRQIGEELWLSPTTIRSLKKAVSGNSIKEYQSYRLCKNKRAKIAASKNKKEIIETPGWVDWIDYCASVFPRKTGPRWKFFK